MQKSWLNIIRAGTAGDHFHTIFTGGNMPTTWTIAANAGRARIFSDADKASSLQEVDDLVNPAAQQRVLDIVTDKMSPRSAQNSGHNIGGGQGGGFQHAAPAGAQGNDYQPAVTPAEHESQRFAKDISNYLQQAHQAGRFQQLVLAASPEFLGVLREKIDPQIKALIKREVNKDYTHSNGQELRAQLDAHQDKSA
ncbi:host attachment protein [Massilia arenae]|nr:host attachment protein [Massilia arenae]